MSSLEARPAIFDVEAVSWAQNGDANAFLPAPELIVAPRIYDVQPYEREPVRVALKAPYELARTERAYRLRFREVRAPGATGIARIIEIPVFVAPAERRGEARYELRDEGGGRAILTVRNDSNEHVRLENIRIELAGVQAYSGSIDAYVLAGNTRSFPISLSQGLRGAQEVKIVLRSGDSETTVNAAIR